MVDHTDRYLGRSLKNWVAKYRPPAGGRARLLETAMALPKPQERPLLRYLNLWRNRYSPPPYAFYPHRDWRFIGPFTQSTIWSFHLATEWRLAH
jgi:hypothetical protein